MTTTMLEVARSIIARAEEGTKSMSDADRIAYLVKNHEWPRSAVVELVAQLRSR